jgi:hypothetical protein
LRQGGVRKRQGLKGMHMCATGFSETICAGGCQPRPPPDPSIHLPPAAPPLSIPGV